MTKQDIINAAQSTLEELRTDKNIPYDTGNMARNALRINITQKEVVIFLDQSKAPYVPYTNEPWVAAKWKDTKNPNEGWWERFVEEFVRRFAQKIGGKIE